MRDPGVMLDTEPELPPWRSADKADQERLRQWTIQQLVNEDAIHDHYDADAERDYGSMALSLTPAEARRVFWFEHAKMVARNGDATLLRKFYPPEMAEFIQPPRRQRGEHRVDYQQELMLWRLRDALDDVHRIRAIWARHFSKWKRPKGDPVSAEAIAAERHGLTKAMVIEAMKRMVGGLRNFPSKSTQKMGSS